MRRSWLRKKARDWRVCSSSGKRLCVSNQARATLLASSGSSRISLWAIARERSTMFALFQRNRDCKAVVVESRWVVEVID